MGVTGRDLRVVDGAYTEDPDAPVGPPIARLLGPLPRRARRPRHPCRAAGPVHRAHADRRRPPAPRRHRAGPGPPHALDGRSTPSTCPCTERSQADEWMLYHHLSTFAGDGMTHAECRVHAEGRGAARLLHRRGHGASVPRYGRPHGTSAPRCEPHHGPRAPQRPAGRPLQRSDARARRVHRALPAPRQSDQGRTYGGRQRAGPARAPSRTTARLQPSRRRRGRAAGGARARHPRVRHGRVGRPSTPGSRRTRRCSDTLATRTTGWTASGRGARLRVEANGVTLVDYAEHARRLRDRARTSPLRRALLRAHGPAPGAARPTTYCPYKGTATYWTAHVGDARVADVAWSYEDPLPESSPLGRFLSFDEGRVTVQHDLPTPAEPREPEIGHR